MNASAPNVPRYLPRAGLQRSLVSRVAERIASSHDPLARLRAGNALELYYEAGDPHSQLCAALARRMLPRLKIPLHVRLVPAPAAETYPEADKQRAFSAMDAARIAPCHGLPAPRRLAEQQRSALERRLAAAGSDAAAFLAAEAQTLADPATLASDSAPDTRVGPLLQANAARRAKIGHYLPAMWQYRGEWFWALDRLDFLLDRLVERNAIDRREPLSLFAPGALRGTPFAAGTPLEFWYSFRSPYSYLAAVELLRYREQHRFMNLQVRPVLPMVMRGLPVPRAKRLYIVRDVKRCADALGIPFGAIHDPVGDGVLRLLTVFPYDADADTQLRYCAVAGQSIWAEGLDLRRDEALASVFDRCGLNWSAARDQLAAGTDTRRAEANREALITADLWGVPSFRLGEFTTWGRDRIWMLQRLMPETVP